MDSHAVFYITPILSLGMTVMLTSVAMLSKSKKGEIPIPIGVLCLVGVIGWHWFVANATSSLSGKQHIKYYTALFEYGNHFDRGFNYIFLGIQGFLFLGAILVLLGLMKVDE